MKKESRLPALLGDTFRDALELESREGARAWWSNTIHTPHFLLINTACFSLLKTRLVGSPLPPSIHHPATPVY